MQKRTSRSGNNHSHARMRTILDLHAQFRGLYSRVARKAGVDASYVSRVARGERRSPRVEKLLQSEVKRLLPT